MLILISEMEHNRNIQESEQLKLIHNYSWKNSEHKHTLEVLSLYRENSIHKINSYLSLMNASSTVQDINQGNYSMIKK